jgi:hypothetical protein
MRSWRISDFIMTYENILYAKSIDMGIGIPNLFCLFLCPLAPELQDCSDWLGFFLNRCSFK